MWDSEKYDLAPSEIQTARKRLMFSGVIVFSIFFGIFSNLLSLPFHLPMGQKNNTDKNQKLTRNDILDVNNKVLATSIPAWLISVEPNEVIDPINSAKIINELMPEKNYTNILEKLVSKRQNEEIDRRASPKIYKKLLNSGLTGLHFKKIETRLYPMRTLASHIIGSVNREGNGSSGIEYKLNNLLLENNSPIKLTIDINIQYIVEQELKKQIEFFSALGGVGLVLNIKNGELVAIASHPSYDSNYFNLANSLEKFNKATHGAYEMGSTFKLLNTAIAIDSGKIDFKDRFDTTKPIYIGKHLVSDYHFLEKPAGMAEILITSSNIGSALIAEIVGPKLQKNYMKKLGLLNKPDLPLAELANTIQPPIWSKNAAMSIAYGHGIAVSPLQLASAVGAIMNDGNFIEPKIIKSNEESIVSRKVFKKRTSQIMRKLTRQIIVHPKGTGKFADAEGYLVGGKTGTADKTSKNGGYRKNANLVSFLGVFPMNKPEYIVLVMVDEPKPQYEKLKHRLTTAGHVAAPVVKTIIEKSAPLLNIHPIDIKLPKIKQAMELIELGIEMESNNASF